MLLAIDVGNTNTVLGVFKKARLVESFRFSTDERRTSDELSVLVQGIFNNSGLKISEVDAVIVSCVVPPARIHLRNMLQKTFGIEPLMVEPGIKTGMPILYDNPKEVGADRIVNGVAAYEKYGGPIVVVDFGTATTFDLISEKGEYIGGAIAPGLEISADALFKAAARLYRVDIQKPTSVIGKTTMHSMQSGLYYGYISLVDGMLERIMAEVKQPLKVAATGGLARLISTESKHLKNVDRNLTLEGLRIIYQRNRPMDR